MGDIFPWEFLWKIQGKSGKIHGKSGKIHGKSGKIQGKSGKIQGKSGKIHGKSGKIQGKSGKIHGKSGKIHGEIDGILNHWGTFLEMGKDHGRIKKHETPNLMKLQICQIFFCDQICFVVLVVIHIRPTTNPPGPHC